MKYTTDKLLSKFDELLTEACETLDHRRANLASNLRKGYALRDLHNDFLETTAKEARVYFLSSFLSGARTTEEEGSDLRDFTRATIEDTMLSGADDRWSGRTNDLNRARHDEVTRVCKTLLSYIS
jgi:hypothetical protein